MKLKGMVALNLVALFLGQGAFASEFLCLPDALSDRPGGVQLVEKAIIKDSTLSLVILDRNGRNPVAGSLVPSQTLKDTVELESGISTQIGLNAVVFEFSGKKMIVSEIERPRIRQGLDCRELRN